MAGILIQNSTASITGNTLYNNVTGTMWTAQVEITGDPSYVSSLTGNVLYSLQPIAWTLEAAGRDRLGFSDNNYFFNPYQASHISVEGLHTLAGLRVFSGQDAASKAAWFSLAVGTPPNSSLYYNDTDQTKTINLGSVLYKDLDQNLVFGSLSLQPYHSTVLVNSGVLPDLVLKMAAVGTMETNPAAPLTYTLTVSNPGTAPASDVVLTNPVPDAITSTSWQASTGGVTARSGSRYGWDLPDIAPGAAVTITVTGQYASTLTAGTPVASTAEVSTSTPEVTSTNNRDVLLFGTLFKVYLPLARR